MAKRAAAASTPEEQDSSLASSQPAVSQQQPKRLTLDVANKGALQVSIGPVCVGSDLSFLDKVIIP